MPMRLQKFLARAGVASRRKCEEYILAGRVSVNGSVVSEMGVQVDPAKDQVAFDGEPIRLPEEHVVIALNKPVGVFTTMHEQRGRVCVANYLPMDEYPGLFHIGRLDGDTTGILLFTNDGELGNRMLHPSNHVDKEYVAQVRGIPTEYELDRIRDGIRIEQGERIHQCAPAYAEFLSQLPKWIRRQDSCLDASLKGTSFVVLRIHEGVKHQVKLMLKEIGHPVVNLHRSSFATIECDSLKQGEWRFVEPGELPAVE